MNKKLIALLMAAALGLTALVGCNQITESSEVPDSSAPVAETPASSEVADDIEPVAVAEDEGLYSQDVELTNSTGVAIVEIYISQSDKDNWEEELLGGSTFAAGSTKEFVTDELGTENTTWDFLLIDEEGDALEFYKISLSAAVALEFHWGDGYTPSVTVTNADGSGFTEEGVYEEEYYSQNVWLYNGLMFSIYELYISPSNDEMWGVDLLEGREFAHDESRPFMTEYEFTADATWDIKVVDEDGEYITFTGVNFSASEVIALAWDEEGIPTAYML